MKKYEMVKNKNTGAKVYLPAPFGLPMMDMPFKRAEEAQREAERLEELINKEMNERNTEQGSSNFPSAESFGNATITQTNPVKSE